VEISVVKKLPELAGETPAAEEETLLAAPAKRDDVAGGYVTPGSKGKVYYPVKDDKRDIGARHRRTKGSWSDETGRPTTRNIWKAPSLIKLSESLSEDLESNYSDEEELLTEVNQSVRNLISELEKKDNAEETQ
jgi:hypothetical protein